MTAVPPNRPQDCYAASRFCGGRRSASCIQIEYPIDLSRGTNLQHGGNPLVQVIILRDTSNVFSGLAYHRAQLRIRVRLLGRCGPERPATLRWQVDRLRWIGHSRGCVWLKAPEPGVG